MIEIISCAQGSPEWLMARLGLPTASRFADVLAKGQGIVRRKYMMTLLGEGMTGQPAASYSNAHMERGKVMEEEACEMYSFTREISLTKVGFIRNGRVGCSPDRLIGNDGMVEAKTKLPHLQIEVLLADKLPSEHVHQVQGGLWVAEREWCDFLSYWPGLPMFVTRVYRDQPYIEKLAKEVSAFLDEMDGLETRLRKMAA